VTPRGNARLVERLPGWAVLQDVAGDGSVLVTKERIRVRAFASTPEIGSEREISWLDGTNVSDISRDGRHVLFTEAAAGGGQGFSAYIRGVDSSPPVRLADGSALALSPLKNVAVIYSILKERLIAVPTGAGESRELPRGAITSYTTGIQSAGWLPDGRLVFDARADQGPVRLFIQDLTDGDPEPTKVETNNSGWAISPDGSEVAVDTPAGPEIRTLVTGGSMPLRSVSKEDRVAAWNRDGIFVVAKSDFRSSVIDRIDPKTGKRTHWRTLVNPERVGIEQPFADSPIIIDSDTYAFGFLQVLSELVVVRGLR
jgi:hypothetical protein